MTPVDDDSADRRPAHGNLLRRALRMLRHLPDRLLHPWRRRKVLRALRGRPRPRSILVVCHGNICRSPYAAAVLRRSLPAEAARHLQVRSAGFIGPGRGSPPEAITVAARHGIDLTAHRSAPITVDSVRGSELILVMDVDQHQAIVRRFGRAAHDVVVLGDLDPAPIDTRTIRDPVEQPLDVFEESYARIDRCVSVLVRAVARRD